MVAARAPAAPFALLRQSALGLGLVLAPAGCSSELSFGYRLDAGSALREDAGSVVPEDARTVDVPDPPTPFSCTQRGPAFDLSDGAPGACGAASRGFHYATCACEDLVSSGQARVDGFDSQLAAYSAGQPSGALATNRALYLETGDIGGSLLIAGSVGTALLDDLTIGGNLLDQGPLQGPYTVRVAGNAQVGGDVRVAELHVGGSFTLAPNAALEVTSGAPPVVRAKVSVPSPCSCSPQLDLTGLIDAASTDNHNAIIGLDADSSLKVFAGARELELPCGRYYVGDVYAAGALTLRVTGRVELYVQNGIVVENTGALTIRLENEAELDLFVAREVSASGPVQIGLPGAPPRTRLYFDETNSLFFGAPTTLSASVYAPRAELVAKGGFELFGAALVRRVASGPLTLHYDRALARDGCAAARCASSTDCAAGLRCDATHCLP